MTETQTKLVNSKGQECDHDAVVGLMDNDIREQLHDRVSNDCSEQEFFEQYAERHRAATGEAFPPWTGEAW